ncbi:MAG TPA: homocysteine S-methyltransferase family protein [Solirubrobacteraceae bacterium]|nr:homocysteine S-methyltransferase family protein [Solirubrobacteraceae bacterium]
MKGEHGHSTLERSREARIEALKSAAAARILVLDGAWGAQIQEHRLTEEQFRGERFADHPVPLKGNNDILCLTRPELISELISDYLDAGADIVSTNTFTSTAIAQADYGTEGCAYDLNLAAARLARAAADGFTVADPAKPRWVAGSIGPTNRTLSMSSDVNDPGARAVDFDQVYDAYREQAIALYDGGVDLFLVETIFDTLNAKAALKAILDLQDEGRTELPIWISGTVTDRSGRILSGQTIDAFWISVRHAEPFAVGLNCAFGADQLRPFLAQLAGVADTLISAYPNAGLPNELGEYEEGPEEMSTQLREWAQSGLVNIVGGCCGTTPAHIRAIAEAVAGLPPRPVPDVKPTLRLSGLEPFAAA